VTVLPNPLTPCSERTGRTMTPEDIKNTILEGKRYSGPMIDKGYMDSLGLLNLVLFLEDEFEIIVLNEDMTAENFDTLNKSSFP
jgi:hypothetical protein